MSQSQHVESVPLQGEQLALHWRGGRAGEGGQGRGGGGAPIVYRHPNAPPSLPPMRQVLSLFILQMRKSGLTSFRNLPEVPEDRTESARLGGSLESCVTLRLFTYYMIIASVLVQDSNVQSLVLGVGVGWELFYQRGEGEKGLGTVALLTDTSFSFFSSPL